MKRIFVGFLVFCLGFCGYWYTLRVGLERALETAKAEIAQDGLNLSLPKVAYSGFPLSVRADLTEPHVAGPTGSVRAEAFALSASVFKPMHWTLQSRGDMRVDWRKDAQTRYFFDVSPSLIRGDFTAALSGALTAARITGFKLKATPVIGTPPPFRAVESVVLDIKPDGDDMGFDLSLVNAFLNRSAGRDIQRLFGPHIKALSAKGTLGGLESLDEAAIDLWRENGQFTVTDSDLIWGDGQFKSSAVLTLSDGGTSGEITLKLRDAQSLLEGLIASGTLDPQTAMGARFALLAAPRDENGLITLTLPIDRNDVKLFGQTVFKI